MPAWMHPLWELESNPLVPKTLMFEIFTSIQNVMSFSVDSKFKGISWVREFKSIQLILAIKGENSGKNKI
jgi:hypothetical protein